MAFTMMITVTPWSVGQNNYKFLVERKEAIGQSGIVGKETDALIAYLFTDQDYNNISTLELSR